MIGGAVEGNNGFATAAAAAGIATGEAGGAAVGGVLAVAGTGTALATSVAGFDLGGAMPRSRYSVRQQVVGLVVDLGIEFGARHADLGIPGPDELGVGRRRDGREPVFPLARSSAHQ